MDIGVFNIGIFRPVRSLKEARFIMQGKLLIAVANALRTYGRNL